MEELHVQFDFELSNEERRIISFASDKICSYEIDGKIVKLMLKDDACKADIEKRLKKLVKSQHKNEVARVLHSSYVERSYSYDEEILNNGIIKRESDGCISLSELGIKLYQFFDQYFFSILKDTKVIIKQFPTLLNLDTIYSTKYMSTSPQYVIFCSKVKESISEYEDLNDKYLKKNVDTSLDYPQITLSPSACFHLYQSIANQVLEENSMYTMIQNVFRNEGRFNWNELERLQDYHVREIVIIGDREFVLNERERLLQKSIKLLDDLKLNYSIEVASDPFIMPDMQKYANIQFANQIKYEMRLNISEQKTVACGSFNIHGKAFTGRFNFSVKDCMNTESGCIGFGIERLIIAFLKQNGTLVSKWPKIVREYIERGRLEIGDI